jgi:hypothetical protein
MVRYDPARRQIFVAFHEWAWSLRTSGFGVYEVTPGGVNKIGVTSKRPSVFKVSSDAIAVVRYYVTNRGYRKFYLYPLWMTAENGELLELPIDEKHNFEFTREKVPREKLETLKQRILEFFLNKTSK